MKIKLKSGRISNYTAIKLSFVFILQFFFAGSAISQINWTYSIPFSGNFSSPWALDLNSDGVKDIILGGGMEFAPSPDAVSAINGLDGSLIWKQSAYDQLFSSPQFLDCNSDGQEDVLIGGRSGQFYALDGTTGFPIWSVDTAFLPQFNGYLFNFYTPQIVPDQDGDFVADLINVYGGYPIATSTDSIRPPAYLCLISGRDGGLISIAVVPDSQESYCSPLVANFFDDDSISIIFGTGGETLPGSMWVASLASLKAENLNPAISVATDSEKGFVAVPSLVDLNSDGVFDLVIPGMNGSLSAFDVKNNNLLWAKSDDSTELYVSPTIGQFNADAIPDVAIFRLKGEWPFYQKSYLQVLNGGDGGILLEDSFQGYQLNGGVAGDINGDGWDELLFLENQDTGTGAAHFTCQLNVYDFMAGGSYSWGNSFSGTSVFPHPLIQDLDDDGVEEMVLPIAPDTSAWYHFNGMDVHCDSIEFSGSLAWTGYLGLKRDGKYYGNISSSISPKAKLPKPIVFPNPFSHSIRVVGINITELRLFDSKARLVKRGSNELDTQDLPAGIYLLEISRGGLLYKEILVKQ